MRVAVRSFAKINLGLRIGRLREDGFHELHTVYQTMALHDVVRVHTGRGSGITIACTNPHVPVDQRNTCYRMAELVLELMNKRSRVEIWIEKKLPMQGGLGAASANAVATLLGLERALRVHIPTEQKLRLAAEVGSDVPLFLVGGTVLGVGRGEQVYALTDLPAIPCVVAMPDAGVSTSQAFQDWDALHTPGKLTDEAGLGKIKEYGCAEVAWLWATVTGVSAKGRNRAEAPLLDLVRAGIENDFERVVFPKHPELRKAKSVLVQAGAVYASLSGSGSSLYGLFRSTARADAAARRLQKQGIPAQATRTMTRKQYWQKLFR